MSSRYDRLVPGRIVLGLLRSFAGTSCRQRSPASKPWNKAVDFSKLTKYCDSFRFLKLFCVYFYWEGTYYTFPFCFSFNRCNYIYACYIIVRMPPKQVYTIPIHNHNSRDFPHHLLHMKQILPA